MADLELEQIMSEYLPVFESVEEERLHRKQRLAAAYRLFGRFGFDEGVAGHITMRDPERPDHFWVNPRKLDPLTQDACAFYEDHALFDDFTGVVLDLEEGKRIAHALGEHKAVILRNHGLLTVGHSVDEAAWWFITMERTCQAQLLAEAAGSPVLIDHEHAALTATQVGGHAAGWFSFQPMYQKIVREQPDLLD